MKAILGSILGRIPIPSPAMVVALVALLIAASGAAVAAIPSSDGTITACRDAKSGTLRVIDAEGGQKCASRETQLAWKNGITGKVANSDLLDGQDSSGFYAVGSEVEDSNHADQADTATSAQNAANADKLDNLNSTDFVHGSGELIFDRTGNVALDSGSVQVLDVPGVGSIDLDCRDDFSLGPDPETDQELLAYGFTLTYTNNSGGSQQVVAEYGSQNDQEENTIVGNVLNASGGRGFMFLHNDGGGFRPDYKGHRLSLQVTPTPSNEATPMALTTFEVTALTILEDLEGTFNCRFQGVATVLQ